MGSLPKPYALGLRCAKLTPALTYMSEDKLAEFCKGEVDGSTLVTETDLAVSTAGWLNAMDLPEANYSLLTYSADDGVGGEQMRAAATEAAARHPHSTVMSIMPHVKKFDDRCRLHLYSHTVPFRCRLRCQPCAVHFIGRTSLFAKVEQSKKLSIGRPRSNNLLLLPPPRPP